MKTTEKNEEWKRTVHSVLRQFPYGLYGVCVCDDEGRANALVASWVSQCSFEPPMMMMAVSEDSFSARLLKTGSVFSVNLLDPDDEEIARQLVKPSHRVGDKLSGVAHRFEVTGAPVLEKALAFLECRVTATSSPGDHVVAMGKIVNAGLSEKKPALTCADIGWHYA